MHNKTWIHLISTVALILPLAGGAMADERKDLAFDVKQVMQRHNIPGTVAISFGPAEEQIASRPFIVRAGYFKDVDAVIYLHIGGTLNTGFGIGNYAAISSVFTFHGKTAHGAVNPWDGKDAVDAVVLMDMGFDKLREHLRPSYRAHRT